MTILLFRLLHVLVFVAALYVPPIVEAFPIPGIAPQRTVLLSPQLQLRQQQLLQPHRAGYSRLPSSYSTYEIENKDEIDISIISSNEKLYQDELKKEIRIWQGLIIAASILTLGNLPVLDHSLLKIWNVVSIKNWFRHDMFEPFVAVGSFALWLHGWLILDVLSTHPRAHAIWQRFRKYRIQDQEFVWRNGVEREQMNEKKPLLALPSPNRWYAGWVWELVVYIAPLWALATKTNVFAPRRAALSMPAPSFLTLVGQICGGLFFYDLFFFFGHWLMHQSHRLHPSLYVFLHGKHHMNRDVRASDTVRLTVTEEVVDVTCSIAALRLMRAHPLSRALYNVLITFWLVELHCGYDMPWSPQNLAPSLCAGSKRHHHHHKHNQLYYQKFFRYLDDGYNHLLQKFPMIGKLLEGERWHPTARASFVA
eukprot:CAMPEP_0174963306 /NCGR_PEP_ID=MMETSP0004_2-20121128/5257_1 /TAXON_ID=420556 /ORGANISM="Ochromonas sp., Strain CCMP1393" /LENGTH=422 /DNA_ID=CAMNT_0016211917 /DNA_START=8 /DNA_END=1276 /DNA_ORIENTATION=+